jgi:spore coat protein A, manganese oxidase
LPPPVPRLARRCALLGALCALLPAAAAQAAFETALPIPPVLTGTDITIPIEEADVPILSGTPTHMWTFDGSFPGPTIRVPAGQTTHVTFENQLPESTGSLTIHNHGAHVTESEDGQPDGFLIPPGQNRTYTYPLTENGGPERAAFQWYHDHRVDVTGRNVYNGLAGMFIIDDAVDSALPLPSGAFDVPLMVVDRTFDSNNQLSYPTPVPYGTLGRTYPGGPAPPNDAFQGTTLLVNGAAQPYLDVQPRRYRIRLLNASNGSTYTFSLSNGQAMTQIATESGLLPAPVDRTSITLGPAERAEVVIDFADDVNSSVVLKTDSFGDAMEFKVSPTPVSDPSSVPSALRPAPDLGQPDRTRSFNLGLSEVQRSGGGYFWGINGKPYDGSIALAGPKLGSTELWTITGGSKIHTLHVHGNDFEVVSRNGQPPPAWEAGLKETVLIHPGETVQILIRFTDYTGSFVFHCHVLEHEDNGMMARYATSLTGDGGDQQQPPPDTSPPPTTTTSDQTPPPPPPPAGRAVLSLRWASPPKRLARHTRLRLVARNGGTATAAAATIRLRAPRPLGLKRILSLPALAAGASKTFTFRLARLPQSRSLEVLATAGSARAQLDYRLRRGRFVRGAVAAGARWFCPLAA